MAESLGEQMGWHHWNSSNAKPHFSRLLKATKMNVCVLKQNQRLIGTKRQRDFLIRTFYMLNINGKLRNFFAYKKRV